MINAGDVRPLSRRALHRVAVVLGIGIALFPVHNTWLTGASTINGAVTLFVPAIGAAIVVIVPALFILGSWRSFNWKQWGDKQVVIPLLIIVLAIGLSGITADTWGARLSPIMMGMALFCLYLVTRVLGKDVFLPLAIGAGIASLGILLHGVLVPGQETGGFVFEGNFDIATGYVLLGAALFLHRWQWLLAGLAVLAMTVSGSPEAVFALGVMGLVVLIRRDWSKRLVAVAGVVALVAIAGIAMGWGIELYSYVRMAAYNDPVALYEAPGDSGEMAWVSPLEMRGRVVRDALSNIKLLGEGYNLTEYTVHTVHNVPLVIVQQLGWPGVLAGLAWLWVAAWCLVKTRWKYVWVLLLTLSVFDHYVWTQLAPVWWAVVGVSTMSTAESAPGSDMVFRKTTERGNREHGQ